MKKITFLLSLLISAICFGQTLEGTWKLKPAAGSLGVGPNQGDTSWWSNSAADVTTRACLFDDEYVFGATDAFDNVLGTDTWIEAWQGGGDSCGAPVAPHNSSAAATYNYDSGAGTLTINGTGAYMGIPKPVNGSELASPAAAPASVTYTVTSFTATELVLDINVGSGWWHYTFEKQVATPITLEGTWKLKPAAGSLGVGPNQGDTSWWSNSAADVTTRACLFDDEYVFGATDAFDNVLGTDTWIEAWQGGGDSCGAPVAPHNSSAAATYNYDSGAGTLTINGTGAYMGIPKPVNGSELASPAAAPASVTYTVTSFTATELVLDINVGSGWWRYTFAKNDPATCTDGIMNGDETGIDCGGSNCAPCAVAPLTAAPTPPGRPTADVVSIFSDAYTDIAVNEWGPVWGASSSRINDISIATNASKVMEVGAGQTFAGIDFAPSAFDATSFTHFHVDYYINNPLPTGQALSIKLSNHVGGAGETSAIETVPTPTGGSWVSLDIPLDNFTAASAPANLDRSAIAQIAITAARADGNAPVDVYLDNIYFHKNTELNTQEFDKAQFKVYPNPTLNNWNIESNTTIRTITVYDILGKQVTSLSPNQSNVEINTSNIKSGVYFAKINSDNGSKTVKLVKQ